MHIITLLANPANPILDSGLVERLRRHWSGGEINWLAPDEAAEFSLPAQPKDRWSLWEELQPLGIDLLVQPLNGRRKRVLLADMDSTMIEQECIDELAEVAGVADRVRGITAKAMNGELGFEQALVKRVALFAGLSEHAIAKVLAESVSYRAGGAELLATMKANGAYTVLVSGGFTAFTRHVAMRLGFDEERANILEIENGVMTGKVREPVLGRAAKARTLSEITTRLGISAADVLAVGDGANDLDMLVRAGSGVAFHAKPAVLAQCDLRVVHGDLTALLYVQGYARSEFLDP